MITVIIANKKQHRRQIRELLREHLIWAYTRVREQFHIEFNIDVMLEKDMKNLNKFMPPLGRLFLAFNDNRPAGIACIKALTPDTGEIKRMYVRPENRNQGLGCALLNRLLEESGRIGYERLRLDSAPFMTEAHTLYRTAGFTEIDAYEGTDIPKELRGYWVFMEKDLP
jgi:ribosomal protein S18 acetylase RimI-like enzyme